MELILVGGQMERKVLGGDGRTMGCLQGSDALPSYAQGKKVTHGQCPMLQSRNIEGETKLFKFVKDKTYLS